MTADPKWLAKAEEAAWPHLHLDDDCWYCCSQCTVDVPAGEFCCADDSRRGKPCDCGRDECVKAILTLVEEAHAEGRRETLEELLSLAERAGPIRPSQIADLLPKAPE
jgi:hypothetical protein